MVGFTHENIGALITEANRIIADSIALKESMDELREWDSPVEVIINIVDVTDFLMNVILVIEMSSNNLVDSFFEIKSSQKLTAAVKIIDRLVVLPWYLEIVDGFFFRILISAMVCMMNKWFGVNWDLVLAGISFNTGLDYTALVKGNQR